MRRLLLIFLSLSGCGGIAWNTTLADHPQVRTAMLASVLPDKTTEKNFVSRWGNPTQKIREGAQVSYVYRNMSNPPGFYVPQFGTSADYVIVTFQYGLAIGAVSSDGEGCRATFPPRPPGPGFDNPSTVHAVNCGVIYTGETEFRPIAQGIGWLVGRSIEEDAATPTVPRVPVDSYLGEGKYR